MDSDKVLVNVRMRRALVEEMKTAAERMDITTSHFVRMAIKRMLEEIKYKERRESV